VARRMAWLRTRRLPRPERHGLAQPWALGQYEAGSWVHVLSVAGHERAVEAILVPAIHFMTLFALRGP
jgi:hypothetical protein